MKKWMKWAIGICVVANAVLFVYEMNLGALLWMGVCCLWIWISETQCKKIKTQDEVISYLENHPSWLMCLDAERRAERYKDDLARALKNMVKLKDANKTLGILNHNLLHNQGKGVKNYAKHTNRRTDTKGIA